MKANNIIAEANAYAHMKQQLANQAHKQRLAKLQEAEICSNPPMVGILGTYGGYELHKIAPQATRYPMSPAVMVTHASRPWLTINGDGTVTQLDIEHAKRHAADALATWKAVGISTNDVLSIAVAEAYALGKAHATPNRAGRVRDL